MPTDKESYYQRPQRRRKDWDVNLLRNLLMQSEMEQEETRPGSAQFRPGQVPSAMATNLLLGNLPMSREQERESDVLEEMDDRYFRDREEDRRRRGLVEGAKTFATIRDFETRREPAEEIGPPDPTVPVRNIRRFGTSTMPADPDAAMGALQRAQIDPRVLAANAAAQGRIGAAQIAADAKAGAGGAQAEDEEDQYEELIRLAEEVKANPNLDWNVGTIDARLPTWFAGSEEFNTKAERLQNMLALASRGQLKGQGQITDFETKMLLKAAQALNPRMGEKAYRAELDRIIGAGEVKRQRVRTRGAAGSRGTLTYNPATGQVE